jgi:ribosome maturation factor RimP
MRNALLAALMSVALVAGTSAAALAQTSSTTAQESQRIHGSVVGVQGNTLTFKTDDGRTLTVDVSKVDPAVRSALTPNETATIIGTPGSQANQFTARYVQQDSSDPSRGGTVAGQTGAASDQDWQRIHGTIGSVSGNTLTLKTDGGQTLNVDMAQVDPGIRSALTTGQGVTVIGFYRGADKKTVDARFIQQDSSRGAASPKTTK